MNEAPLHNPLKQDGSSNRSTLKTTLLVVLALVAVASIGYSIYAWMQNRQLSNDVTNKNNQIATLQKQQTPPAKTTPTPPADPYAGWQSATLNYEKATFKYPSTWKLTNTSTPNGTTGNITPGSDQVKLSSPTGLTVTIDTGVSGLGDGPYGNGEVLATPITTLGGNYFLGFGTYGAPTNSSTTSEGIVGTTSTRYATWPTGKNTSSSSGKTYTVISMAYYDASSHAIIKPVSDFQSDSSYNDALLIIKSLSY
ncbi:hypothetical protein GCM10009839_63400 [Catenulispora yoronensis]|uniref:Uncharacterized protein n=1 Tax=Catenulispora yoronensis TaxID=450799 RepID=A0ABP5GKB1_9ACTN